MKAEEFQIQSKPSLNIEFEEYTKSMLNILEDFSEEKSRLEDSQRAMLNLLEDFNMERERAEAVNRELREAERQIKKSLQEKEALLREIHHRVKNNLHIISSMLNLQMPYIKDDKAIEIFKDSQNRIYTMALIHEKLYLSESLARINAAEYIRGLISNLFLSYRVTESTIKTNLNVRDINLPIEALIPCALIINELASNCLKHAFPLPDNNGRAAEIQIDLHPEGNNLYVLNFRDNGVGLSGGFSIENCESLGLKLVSVLVKQLRGDVKILSNGGTEFVIRFHFSP